MKRAIVHLTISVHELKENELREITPLDVMKSYGVPLKAVLAIDGEDDNQILMKLKKWIEDAKN